MPRTLAALTLLTALASVAPQPAAGQLAPPRRQFLFKDDRGDIATAHARGDTTVTVIIAAMPGATSQLAQTIQRMGGTIRFRDDQVDYIRARVPVDSVERLVHDASVHSLDVTMKGADRGFGASGTESFAPADALPLGPRSDLLATARDTGDVWPPKQSSYPLTHRYDPLRDMNGVAFRRDHPTWDGRGVTLALIDMNPDPLEPELQQARTLDGKLVRKIFTYETVIDPDEEDEGRWLKMKDQVTASGGTFTYDGNAYKAPHDGAFRIAILDEAKFDSLSSSGLEKDLNRDGNPPKSSRLFAVIWDEQTNNVWVDTNQNFSFTDEKALTDYRARPEFAVFGTDNAKTAVRESVGFGVQIDKARQMVAINAGVPFHASLIVGSALGSRGAHGRFDGVAPGARLASEAEGCMAYGQTEAVIRALEDPQVDAAWLEQCNNITKPYLLRDGRLVPTVIYSRLIEKFRKPIMIPTHNYPVLGGSDDFVLADCGIGVGGHESQGSFLANYGVRTSYVDNLLITGGYAPMGNGGFGPTILAPSNIISGYRGWEDAASGYMASVFRLPPGYRISGGTSTATPVATGAVALLISAAKQTGIKYDACRIKQALSMSAKYVPNIPVYKQGNGVINIAGAWDLLKAMDKAGEPPTITSAAHVKHTYSALLVKPNEGVGLYERDDWTPGDRGQRTMTFTRTTGPSGAMPFAISVISDSGGRVSAPASVSLPLGVPVPVTLDIAVATPGVHSSLITLDNPSVPGHAYRTLATLVAAVPLDAGNHYKVETRVEVPRPEMRSYFYRVPAGVSSLQIVLDSSKREVQLAVIKPDTRTASATRIVAERAGRGGGGGGGGGENAMLPPATYIVANPMPGVYELRLTDIEDTRTFDWKASEAGTPVPPTKVRLTVSALAAGPAASVVAANPTDQGSGQSAAQQAREMDASNDLTLISRMSDFTGKATSYPLGSAYIARPTIREHQQHVYEIEVPPGSAALRVTVGNPSDATADLDVYVYDCTKKECRTGGASADPGSDETVTVQHPAAGKWKVVVEGASMSSGQTEFDYSDVVFNQVYGMVAVTDTTAKHQQGSSWTVKTNAWIASVPAGRRPYAAVLLEGQVTPAQPFTVTLVPVAVEHRVARP
jgi:hypothetical protein